LAGSYFIEELTDQLEDAARRIIEEVESQGGSVAAIESGWMQSRIEDSAYQEARRQERGESVVIGVNRYVTDQVDPLPGLVVDPVLESDQRRRLASWRQARDGEAVAAALADLEKAASVGDNVLFPLKTAMAVGASLGEAADALRSVFGTYRP
jgi:methylmalonyl-CoA mutase N-terminal domain/subunit